MFDAVLRDDVDAGFGLPVFDDAPEPGPEVVAEPAPFALTLPEPLLNAELVVILETKLGLPWLLAEPPPAAIVPVPESGTIVAPTVAIASIVPTALEGPKEVGFPAPPFTPVCITPPAPVGVVAGAFAAAVTACVSSTVGAAITAAGGVATPSPGQTPAKAATMAPAIPPSGPT